MEEKTPPRGLFTTFRIPVELKEHEGLTLTEAFVYALVKVFDGREHCYAGNEYIGKLLDITPQKVSVSIKKLIELNILQKVSFDGRMRVIKVNPDWQKENRELLLGFNDRMKKLEGGFLLAQENKENGDETKSNDLDSINQTIKSDLIKRFNNKDILKGNLKTKKIISKDIISTSDEVLKQHPLDESDKPFQRRLYKDPLPPKEPLLKDIGIDLEIKKIIQYWEDSGLRKTNIIKKTYKDNITQLRNLMKGTVFNKTNYRTSFTNRKFLPNEIRNSIKKFSLCALDPNYDPVNPSIKSILKRYSIAQFIYNAFIQNGDQSWFIKCFNGSPNAAVDKVKIKEIPENVELIRGVFKAYYLEDLRGNLVKLSPQDENNLTTGAIKLYNFIIDAGKKGNIGDDMEVARLMCEAIMERFNDDPTRISTANFKSDYTFQNILPAKLIKSGRITEYSKGNY